MPSELERTWAMVVSWGRGSLRITYPRGPASCGRLGAGAPPPFEQGGDVVGGERLAQAVHRRDDLGALALEAPRGAQHVLPSELRGRGPPCERLRVRRLSAQEPGAVRP